MVTNVSSWLFFRGGRPFVTKEPLLEIEKGLRVSRGADARAFQWLPSDDFEMEASWSAVAAGDRRPSQFRVEVLGNEGLPPRKKSQLDTFVTIDLSETMLQDTCEAVPSGI